MRTPFSVGLGMLISAALLIFVTPALARAPARTASEPDATSVYPPWQGGRNNDADPRGFEFTVPDADNLADFHGDPTNPALSLYVGGNYFFAMAPLVATFEAKYPQYKGHLYSKTIPPGLLVRQMQAGGTVTVGNMTWTVKPDVYLAGLAAVKKQIDAGLLSGPAVPYVTNVLAIMVPKGNPAHVASLADLRPFRCQVGHAQPRVRGHRPTDQGIARESGRRSTCHHCL